jgi:hypothetical protein
VNHYDSFWQWQMAEEAATAAWRESHPTFNEQEFHEFYQSWLASNPRPTAPWELQQIQ